MSQQEKACRYFQAETVCPRHSVLSQHNFHRPAVHENKRFRGRIPFIPVHLPCGSQPTGHRTYPQHRPRSVLSAIEAVRHKSRAYVP